MGCNAIQANPKVVENYDGQNPPNPPLKRGTYATRIVILHELSGTKVLLLNVHQKYFWQHLYKSIAVY